MITASESAQDLLKPLAMTAAKMWLTKSGYDSDAYHDKSELQVWFLKGYLALVLIGGYLIILLILFGLEIVTSTRWMAVR